MNGEKCWSNMIERVCVLYSLQKGYSRYCFMTIFCLTNSRHNNIVTLEEKRWIKTRRSLIFLSSKSRDVG